MAKGQVSADELRSKLKLGTTRGQVILRISGKEKEGFVEFVDEFARGNNFLKIASVDKRVLSGHEFMSVWYTRPDGVTMYVTDVTSPEKMRVLFIDSKGDVGAMEAERLYRVFESISSKYRRFE